MKYRVQLECGHAVIAKFDHEPVLAREAVPCDYCHIMATILSATPTVEPVSVEAEQIVEAPPVDKNVNLPLGFYAKVYPCGCSANGPMPLPEYCPEHGSPDGTPIPPTAAERRAARKADKAAATQQAAQDVAEHQADLDVAHEEQAAEDRKEDREFSEAR
jgi:hypothetical protein